MPLSQANFERLIIGPQPASEEHRRQLGDFLKAAGAVAAVHSDAAVKSSAAGYQVGIRQEVVMLLACHSFNLFIELISAVMAERFDAACYLARPIWDVGPILGYVGSDEALAQDFRRGDEIKASSARKAMVERLRLFDPDSAREVDRIFSEDFGPAQEMSHVNLIHVSKLVAATGPQSNTATLGGRVDHEEAVGLLRVAALGESLSLTALRQVGGFGKAWDERCVRALGKLLEWSKSA